jgi:dipeptidase E
MSADAYVNAVREALSPLGATVIGAHETQTPSAELARADAIAVGGGNTFQLLTRLYANELVDPIRERVRGGLPYVGWSAGTNVACPTIMTTNDMPIVEPPSFKALGLVPFQINPHYPEARLPNHGGETRPERIAEFLEVNPAARVVGLREGSGLLVEGKRLSLVGSSNAVVFRRGAPPRESGPGDDLATIILGA